MYRLPPVSSPLVLALILLLGCSAHEPSSQYSVRGHMQARPGGPMEEVEVGVHKVPVDPPSKGAGEVELEDGDLVLGVVVDGEARAFPIRHVSRFEIIDDEVGGTPLAATW